MWNCESVSVSGELFLPEGFESTVFIDSIPEKVRHIAVDATGKVYAKFNKPSDRGVLIALKDVTHDGVADSIIPFGNYSAPQKGGYSTAARIYEGYLYFSSRLAVYRYKLNADTMIPAGPLETVVLDDHSHGSHEHIAKPIAFDNDGNLYVPFGAPSNACQEPKRTPFQAGLNPCPQLIDHAGIWKFDAHQLNQTQADGECYATGIRSLVAMDWNMQENCLFAVVHGRDDLLRLWPAARLHTPPRGTTIGRGMKVNKEEVLGMLVALELYLNKDHNHEWKLWESQIKWISDSALAVTGVETEIHVPPHANHVPSLRVRWDQKKVKVTVEELRKQLREGHPSIETVGDKEHLGITTWMMTPGQERIVAKRIYQILKAAAV